MRLEIQLPLLAAQFLSNRLDKLRPLMVGEPQMIGGMALYTFQAPDGAFIEIPLNETFAISLEVRGGEIRIGFPILLAPAILPVLKPHAASFGFNWVQLRPTPGHFYNITIPGAGQAGFKVTGSQPPEVGRVGN